MAIKKLKDKKLNISVGGKKTYGKWMDFSDVTFLDSIKFWCALIKMGIFGKK